MRTYKYKRNENKQPSIEKCQLPVQMSDGLPLLMNKWYQSHINRRIVYLLNKLSNNWLFSNYCQWDLYQSNIIRLNDANQEICEWLIAKSREKNPIFFERTSSTVYWGLNYTKTHRRWAVEFHLLWSGLIQTYPNKPVPSSGGIQEI